MNGIKVSSQKRPSAKKPKDSNVAAAAASPPIPEKSINLTILRYQGRKKIWWPLIFLANAALWPVWHIGNAVRLTPYWIWRHKGHIFRGLAVLFWRSTTLLSVIYLVYDRIYEADATISVQASDPQFAFEFPFTIKNSSHIFHIKNVRWACQYLRIKFGNNNTISDSEMIRGSVATIAPGQSLNIDCSAVGPTSRFVRTPQKVAVQEAVIKIALAYDADLFGLISLPRRPTPTIFTWFADASNPQWIKGVTAK